MSRDLAHAQTATLRIRKPGTTDQMVILEFLPEAHSLNSHVCECVVKMYA